MRIIYNKSFQKSFAKLPPGSQEKFWTAIEIFAIDPFDRRLNNHPLKGEFADCRSINIGGDLRAIYKRISNEASFFIEIGTHHELYGR